MEFFLFFFLVEGFLFVNWDFGVGKGTWDWVFLGTRGFWGGALVLILQDDAKTRKKVGKWISHWPMPIALGKVTIIFFLDPKGTKYKSHNYFFQYTSHFFTQKKYFPFLLYLLTNSLDYVSKSSFFY